MDGDWETVQAKPKKTNKKPQEEQIKHHYGGKTSGGMLIAGPIRDGQAMSSSKKGVLNNQASAIADFDYHVDDDYYEEVKTELVSHTLSLAVAEARLKKNWTQEKLAQQIGEKAHVIHDIENGTAPYKGGQINAIEKALGVKLDRGRKKK